jgi:TM2 domain-containing membrane protein YozV
MNNIILGCLDSQEPVVIMFCQKCGKSLDDSVKFCDACGTPTGSATGSMPQQAPAPAPSPYGPAPAPGQAPYMLPQKSLGIALILSLIIPGIGQMYASKFGRGVAMLIGVIVLWVVDAVIWAAAYTLTYDGNTFYWSYNSGAAAAAGVFVLVIIGYHIFAAYDAYKLAQKYNTAAYQTGHAPW